LVLATALALVALALLAYNSIPLMRAEGTYRTPFDFASIACP
jgi:hypothetical protein